MKTKGTGSAYIVSRAVEDPFEATFALGEDISESSYKLRWPVALGILGSIILLILLISNLYYLILIINDIFLKGLELSVFELIIILAISLFLIILFALIATTLIYLTQIYKFNKHLSQRYLLISSLKNAQPLKPTVRKAAKIDSKVKKDDKVAGFGLGKDKHLKNPIFAMLDLVEESMHTIPQITRLLRYCTYFIMLSLVIIFVTITSRFIFGEDFLFFLTPWELVLIISVFIVFVPTIKLLIDSERLFLYLQTRHEIIDTVRFTKNLNVPTGNDQLERLSNYLMETDPYIKSSNLAKVGEFKQNVKLTGRTGEEYPFDAYFHGVNVLKTKSVSLGMPMGDFGVFIRVFKSKITLNKLEALRASVLDVCEKQNMFPLRIIALQWKVEELSDDAYDFVLENPIEFRNTLTYLQVAAEDVDVYSFIPIISYGKEI